MTADPSTLTGETSSPSLSLWQWLRDLAVQILKFGSLLGVVSAALYGRGFKPEELGFVFWPLAGTYLTALFYLLGYQVFTMTSRVHYLVIPLFCLMIGLMLSAAVWAVFFES